jgi:two-component system nitrogen regulation response regulator GlnG
VLSAEAEEELQRRPWAGNAREVRNAVEHALTVARGGVILPQHLPKAVLPSNVHAAPDGRSVEDTLALLVRQWTERRLADGDDGNLYEQLLAIVEPPLLEACLKACDGQYAAAARRLGLHRTTLRKKLAGDSGE